MIAAAVENTTGAGNFYAVRDIAAAVANEFPHVMIETLAYNGAQQTPNQLKFADNIIVRIAGFNMGCGNVFFAMPFYAKNRRFTSPEPVLVNRLS